MCVCVCNSRGVRAEWRSGVKLSVLSVRVSWAQHTAAQGAGTERGGAARGKKGGECNLREWKAFRKRGKPRLGRDVGNKVWHRKGSEVSWVIRDKIEMELSCSLWGDLVAGSGAINFYSKGIRENNHVTKVGDEVSNKITHKQVN